MPSRGRRAVERAVEWVAERQPDLVCGHGRPALAAARRGASCCELLDELPHPYVVLGNHDYAISRDPFSRPVELGRLEHGTMLLDGAEVVELRGKRIELAGVDPRSWLQKRRSDFADPHADLRILLCHFPRALDTRAARAAGT